MKNEEKTYTQRCPKLNKMVTLGWYDKFCECGDPILGVPER